MSCSIRRALAVGRAAALCGAEEVSGPVAGLLAAPDDLRKELRVDPLAADGRDDGEIEPGAWHSWIAVLPGLAGGIPERAIRRVIETVVIKRALIERVDVEYVAFVPDQHRLAADLSRCGWAGICRQDSLLARHIIPVSDRVFEPMPEPVVDCGDRPVASGRAACRLERRVGGRDHVGAC